MADALHGRFSDAIPEVLVLQAMYQIEEHPEDWNQGVWLSAKAGTSCGTVGCLAGWVAILDGAPTDAWLTDGEVHRARDWAMDRLHLDEDQAAYLFNEDNTLDQLRAGVEAYLAGDDIMEALIAAGHTDPDDEDFDDD